MKGRYTMSTAAETGEYGSGVRLVRATERTRAAAQTPGMVREEAFQAAGLWAGIARTAPGNTSGWHHHGDWNTIAYVITGALRLECGPGGRTTVDAEPGDYMFIPGGEVHRESNPSDGEQMLVIVRMGDGPVVVNVAGPPD